MQTAGVPPPFLRKSLPSRVKGYQMSPQRQAPLILPLISKLMAKLRDSLSAAQLPNEI